MALVCEAAEGCMELNVSQQNSVHESLICFSNNPTHARLADISIISCDFWFCFPLANQEVCFLAPTPPAIISYKCSSFR